jgi:hypothetical protein
MKLLFSRNKETRSFDAAMKNALEEVQPDPVMAEHYFAQFQQMQQAQGKKRSRRIFLWLFSAALLIGLSATYYFTSMGGGPSVQNDAGVKPGPVVINPRIEPDNTPAITSQEAPVDPTVNAPREKKDYVTAMQTLPPTEPVIVPLIASSKADTAAIKHIDTIKKVQPKKEDTLFIVW